MNLQVGSHIKQYRIDGLIAKGGMGVVRRAWDADENKYVAIKAVANDLITDPEFKLRIQDEARRHQWIDHPNIVPVLDVFEAYGSTCIVMELVEGISLDTLLESKTDHRLQLREATAILSDILEALDHAHRKGIVHRDVKPANVLLNKNHNALLIDFGIALSVGEKRRTRTGRVLGTPLYMSPEQISKPLHIDHRSDVYSTGCVFYEMLTGRPPFVRGQDGVGDTDFEIQHAHVKAPPIKPTNIVPDIPIAIENLVMAALEKNPDNRISGCREFKILLDQAVKTQTENGPRFKHGKIVIILLFLLLIASAFLILNW